MNLDPNIQILGEDHNIILKMKGMTTWNTKRLFQKGRMINMHQKQKFTCHPCEWFIYLPSVELWRETQTFHTWWDMRDNLTRNCLEKGNQTSMNWIPLMNSIEMILYWTQSI